MKVLFVSSGNAKEGISPIVLRQGKSLIKQGIHVEFFTIKGKGFWSYFRHIYILRKYLKTNNFNIIHAHYGLSAIVAFLAKSKQKIIVSFMGSDILGLSNQNLKIFILSRVEVQINKFLAKKKYDHSIFKSQEMADKVGLQNNYSIISNGVDVNDFYPMDKDKAKQLINIDTNRCNLLFLSDPKRVEKNYSLAKKVLEILGNDVEMNVIFNTKIDKLRCYYNAVNVLILTSLHEGSPNVIKEAMACNCPIVSTDVGDVRWLLGNTDGCFLSTNKPEDFAEKIMSAFEFSKTNEKTNGRDRILELGLDSVTIAKKIIELYNKVLN